MTRTPIIAAAAVLLLAGCANAPAPAEPVGLVAETRALTELEAPAEDRPGAAKRLLRRNTLHGELTVQTRQGVTTVLVQRGEVTAATATGFTVKSTDGFTLTWVFGEKVKVRKDKADAERSAIAAGAQVAVAGAKAGAAATARLVRIR